jgi:aminomethyltransferase
MSELKRTPLYAMHVAAEARMAPFAGYEMPIQYPSGVMAEHLWTRAKAGLFDVSHMGQAWLRGADAAAVLEALTPGTFVGMEEGTQKYALLLTHEGTIQDDWMVSRPHGDGYFLVVNASEKATDFARIAEACMGHEARLEIVEDRALLALQGPEAGAVLAALWPGADELYFMEATRASILGEDVLVSRSGYTGEDGFEISVAATAATPFAEALLRDGRVKWIGLGARDSLRLEAGLCLYGHDITRKTTPVEGNLVWALAKERRAAGGYAGHGPITAHLEDGPPRKRVGLKLLDKAPAREGAMITRDGVDIGIVTSGGFAPSLGYPIAMGYVAAEHATTGTKVELMVRDKPRSAEIVRMPFHPQTYRRRDA